MNKGFASDISKVEDFMKRIVSDITLLQDFNNLYRFLTKSEKLGKSNVSQHP